MEATRAMLHDQDMPMHIWEEAARTTVYVQNHTPLRVLENKTLEEVFSRKKPKVNHLIIFSCPMYIHIPKEKRTKLDPSGKKGIYKTKHFLCFEHLQPVLDKSKKCSLDCCKAHSEVPDGYS